MVLHMAMVSHNHSSHATSLYDLFRAQLAPYGHGFVSLARLHASLDVLRACRRAERISFLPNAVVQGVMLWVAVHMTYLY